MSRLSREELLGGAWQRRTFLNADGSPRLPGERVSERAVTEKRAVNGMETGAVLDSGEIVWAEVSVAPLEVPDVRAVVIMHDITERKQAEQKILAQLDELRRWQEMTMGREDRILELKRDVNKLLQRLGEPARYASQAQP
jgi:PAS domain S-box-containing protein